MCWFVLTANNASIVMRCHVSPPLSRPFPIAFIPPISGDINSQGSISSRIFGSSTLSCCKLTLAATNSSKEYARPKQNYDNILIVASVHLKYHCYGKWGLWDVVRKHVSQILRMGLFAMICNHQLLLHWIRPKVAWACANKERVFECNILTTICWALS